MGRHLRGSPSSRVPEPEEPGGIRRVERHDGLAAEDLGGFPTVDNVGAWISSVFETRCVGGKQRCGLHWCWAKVCDGRDRGSGVDLGLKVHRPDGF